MGIIHKEVAIFHREVAILHWDSSQRDGNP